VSESGTHQNPTCPVNAKSRSMFSSETRSHITMNAHQVSSYTLLLFFLCLRCSAAEVTNTARFESRCRGVPQPAEPQATAPRGPASDAEVAAPRRGLAMLESVLGDDDVVFTLDELSDLVEAQTQVTCTNTNCESESKPEPQESEATPESTPQSPPHQRETPRSVDHLELMERQRGAAVIRLAVHQRAVKKQEEIIARLDAQIKAAKTPTIWMLPEDLANCEWYSVLQDVSRSKVPGQKILKAYWNRSAPQEDIDAGKKILMARGIIFGYPECCCASFSEDVRDVVIHDTKRAPVVDLATKLIRYTIGLQGFVPCHSCAVKIVEVGKTGSFQETKDFITAMFDTQRRGNPLYTQEWDNRVITTEGFPEFNERCAWSPELQKALSGSGSDTNNTNADRTFRANRRRSGPARPAARGARRSCRSTKIKNDSGS